MAKALVSIIIINYKEYGHLRGCLNSLVKYNRSNVEIIVVDNETNLNALDQLKTEFKNVRFYPLKDNVDYIEANNYGLKQSCGDFVVLLNNDTVVTDSWLAPLIREALVEPKAFYQPKILLLDKPDTVNSLGNTIHILGFAFPIGIGKNINEVSLPKEKVEVFYCSGACVFTSKEIINELGGLGSKYWSYYNDVNLGWNGLLHGYRSYLVPDSTIYHKWGASYGSDLSPKKLYLLERGRLSSILRNYSLRSFFLLFPAIWFLDLLLLLYFLPKGLAMAKIQAVVDFLWNLKIILDERRKIQMFRIKSDKEVSLYMSPKLEHPYFDKIPYRVKQLLTIFSRWLMKVL